VADRNSPQKNDWLCENRTNCERRRGNDHALSIASGSANRVLRLSSDNLLEYRTGTCLDWKVWGSELTEIPKQLSESTPFVSIVNNTLGSSGADKPMTARKQFPWRLVLMFGVAIFGVIISLIVFFVARDIELEFTKQQFVAKASEDALVIKAAIAEDLDHISDLRALFETFPDVNLPKFQGFARRLIEHNTSIRSASWIVRVTREGRAAHEADGLHQGIPNYQIRAVDPLGKQPLASPGRDEYFPLFFATDDPASMGAYGLDLGSEEGRLRTVKQARDSGELAVSPVVVLYVGKGDRRGFFCFIAGISVRSSPRFHRGPPPQSGWICGGRISDFHDV
jgi:CHASE domain